jgi:DNA-binding transcriptional regulator/RsmH inhibitor MraZ
VIRRNRESRTRIAADSTVILVGRHSHFEIWNAENFETEQEIECREIADDAFGIL